MKIVKNLTLIEKLSKRYKSKKLKLVLVHGVFDLIHPGHIDYFREAKSYGDILFASITMDKFVNKGFNKPYFNENDRMKFLSNLTLIDHVFCNNSPDSTKLIKKLKPNYYIKGPDYKKKGGDVAGNLDKENASVKKNGGKLIFTTGRMHSSTELLNSNFDEFNPAKKIIKDYFKKNKNYKEPFNTILKKVLDKIKRDKILIIGETIIDKYIYTTPLGKPSKEDILSVAIEKSVSYLGGTIPVVNNISELNNNISLISFYKSEKIKKLIYKKLPKHINLKLFKTNNLRDIEKIRFLNENNSKIFENYNFVNKDLKNQKLKKFLNKNIRKFDHVIVCDFGHGLISKEILKIIETKSKYLSINVQTNSGNRGYNLFSKYSKANLLCLDEGEMRLGVSDRYSERLELFKKPILQRYKNVILTLGSEGHVLKLNKNKKFSFPALSKKVIDTVGAGDAFYSFASCFVKYTKDDLLISLIGGIAGAIQSNFIGHEDRVKLKEIIKSINTLTK